MDSVACCVLEQISSFHITLVYEAVNEYQSVAGATLSPFNCYTLGVPLNHGWSENEVFYVYNDVDTWNN